jgi:hypothetical protein
MARAWIAALVAAAALAAAAAAPHAASNGAPCTPAQTRATFDAFVRAFNRGDRSALDTLVAPAPSFVWFSVSGAGARLGDRSKDRATLDRYFAVRHTQRDQFQDIAWDGGGKGQFHFFLTRLAEDELPSRYEGKGAVVCEPDGDTIAVWSMARKRALPVTAPPARLPAAGWHVGSARLSGAGCAGCVQTASWAATIPYRDAASELPPHRTMAVLPPTGIVVHVTRSWEPSPPAWVHRVRPLRIAPGAVTTSFEGNTTRARVSRWTGSTWRAGSYVDVWVLFGKPTPTRAQLRRAQSELERAVFTSWRIGRH